MATEIKDRTLPKRWRYNWQDKMNGSYWELKRGVDFADSDNGLENARQAAIGYAWRRGLLLSTVKVDEDTLGVQAGTNDG